MLPRLCLVAPVLAGVLAAATANAECRQVQGIHSVWQSCDVPSAEVARRRALLVADPSTLIPPGTGSHTTVPFGDPAGDPTAPSFNWHDLDGKDWMTGVRDQGQCGSCFVFGSIGVLESMYKYTIGNPLLDIDLSEQSVISCISLGSCASGGTAEEVSLRIQSSGVADESCYPYLAADGKCDDKCPDFDQRRWFISSFGFSAMPWSVAELKQRLVYAPVIVNMQVYDDFHGYKSGVYSRSDSAKADGWHVVALVGWDDTDSSWIVRNSWGDDFGQKGYFKISREPDCLVWITGVCFASHATTFTITPEQAPSAVCATEQQVQLSAEKPAKATAKVTLSHCGPSKPVVTVGETLPKAPWLTWDPVSFAVDPGGQQEVTLTADSSTLKAGANKTTLRFKAGAGISSVAVTFDVTEPPPKPEPEPVPEAGPVVDGSEDASSDEGAAAEGAPPAGDDKSCGCRAPGAASGARAWGATMAALLGLMVSRARRRG